MNIIFVEELSRYRPIVDRFYLSWLIIASKDIPSLSIENRACSIDVGIVLKSKSRVSVHIAIKVDDKRIQFVVSTTMLEYQN